MLLLASSLTGCVLMPHVEIIAYGKSNDVIMIYRHGVATVSVRKNKGSDLWKRDTPSLFLCSSDRL